MITHFHSFLLYFINVSSNETIHIYIYIYILHIYPYTHIYIHITSTYIYISNQYNHCYPSRPASSILCSFRRLSLSSFFFCFLNCGKFSTPTLSNPYISYCSPRRCGTARRYPSLPRTLPPAFASASPLSLLIPSPILLRIKYHVFLDQLDPLILPVSLFDLLGHC